MSTASVIDRKTVIDRKSVCELAARFSGALLLPSDAEYDEARRIHNGLIDKRPALIARCLGTADVVDAVNFARIRGIEVAIRGGGHNVAGKAVSDGGLMLDLSRMKGIHVESRTPHTGWRHLARIQTARPNCMASPRRVA